MYMYPSAKKKRAKIDAVSVHCFEFHSLFRVSKQVRHACVTRYAHARILCKSPFFPLSCVAHISFQRFLKDVPAGKNKVSPAKVVW